MWSKTMLELSKYFLEANVVSYQDQSVLYTVIHIICLLPHLIRVMGHTHDKVMITFMT